MKLFVKGFGAKNKYLEVPENPTIGALLSTISTAFGIPQPHITLILNGVAIRPDDPKSVTLSTFMKAYKPDWRLPPETLEILMAMSILGGPGHGYREPLISWLGTLSMGSRVISRDNVLEYFYNSVFTKKVWAKYYEDLGIKPRYFKIIEAFNDKFPADSHPTINVIALQNFLIKTCGEHRLPRTAEPATPEASSDTGSEATATPTSLPSFGS